MDSNTDLDAFAEAFAAERDDYLSEQEKHRSNAKTGYSPPVFPQKKTPRQPTMSPPDKASFKNPKETNKPSQNISHSTDAKPVARKKFVPKEKGIYRVYLRVREKQLAADKVFTYVSNKLSRLEAELDARKAAKEAGWKIVPLVLDIERMPDA